MGINTFSFDGAASSTYGVYIMEGASFNAPERVVEMLEIPGRNGQYALDQGRFDNVEVTYKCFVDGSTRTNFASNLSALRNWLCSKRGYCRLSDTYNPDEYRMAIYKSGLEVTPTSMQSGEFEIVFNCKPQRWLVSGETAETVTSGGTLTNPTLFDASPLLAVKGYGVIAFNGYRITVDNAVMGEVELLNNYGMNQVSYTQNTHTTVLDTAAIPATAYCNIGDTFRAIVDTSVLFRSNAASQTPIVRHTISGTSITTVPSTGTATAPYTSDSMGGVNSTVTIKLNNMVLSGTIGTDATVTTTCTASVTSSISGTAATDTLTVNVTIAYDASDSTITVTEVTGVSGGHFAHKYAASGTVDSFTVDSTVVLLGNPTYIDCDLGEAYKIVSDETVSLNSYIDLGSDLPKLAPSSNTITFDNTITELKVTPRWWKI